MLCFFYSSSQHNSNGSKPKKKPLRFGFSSWELRDSIQVGIQVLGNWGKGFMLYLASNNQIEYSDPNISFLI